MTNHINADLRFSIIPEWLLDSKLSDRAIRVYSVLARYADNETLQAYPSRETLAQRCNCHWRSVDRAIDELVALGAITKSHRKNGDSYQSNLYTLRRVLPAQSGGTDTPVTGVLTQQSVGTDTGGNLTRTTELEPENIEPLNSQSSVNESFNEFWEIYPKRLQKGEARKAFFKAVQREGAVEPILGGVRRMAADPNLPVKQFIPYPATWLNRDGWEDEPFPAREVIPGVSEGASRTLYVGGPREWVRDMHEMGEHFECRPGEFDCK